MFWLTRNRYILSFIHLRSSQTSFRCEMASLRNEQTPWPFQCTELTWPGWENRYSVNTKTDQWYSSPPGPSPPAPLHLSTLYGIAILVQVILFFFFLILKNEFFTKWGKKSPVLIFIILFNKGTVRLFISYVCLFRLFCLSSGRRKKIFVLSFSKCKSTYRTNHISFSSLLSPNRLTNTCNRFLRLWNA